MSRMKKRHAEILEVLARDGQVNAAELANTLNASRETIRRDLNKLAEEGHLIKTHGGAVIPEINTSLFVPVKARERVNFAEKQALCRHIAKVIKEYDTIFLDNSTTILQLLQYVPRQFSLTFITNSIRLLGEFSTLNVRNWNVVLLGGVLDYETYSSNGHLTIGNLENFRPNKAFISCRGINEDLTVGDNRIDDAELKKHIVQKCKETYLLADSSKLPRDSVVKIGNASDFHMIITNENADPLFISHLISNDCQVQIAPFYKEL